MARRLKKANREASDKPHIYPYLGGLLGCMTQSAIGRGETAEAAYYDWKAAQWRAEQEAEQTQAFERKKS